MRKVTTMSVGTHKRYTVVFPNGERVTLEADLLAPWDEEGRVVTLKVLRGNYYHVVATFSASEVLAIFEEGISVLVNQSPSRAR